MKARMVIFSALLLAGLAAGALRPSASAQTEAAGDGSRFEVDSVHSVVVFGIEHLNAGYFYGRFNDPTGTFVFDPDDPSSASFDITIKADDVDTNNGRRDGHLKSADFLNAKQFPEITFKSSEVKKTGGDRYRVTGDLMLHGVTKPLTVELEHIGCSESSRMGHRCGFRGETSIKRSEFGISYMPQGLGEEITLLIGLEGIK